MWQQGREIRLSSENKEDQRGCIGKEQEQRVESYKGSGRVLLDQLSRTLAEGRRSISLGSPLGLRNLVRHGGWQISRLTKPAKDRARGQGVVGPRTQRSLTSIWSKESLCQAPGLVLLSLATPDSDL